MVPKPSGSTPQIPIDARFRFVDKRAIAELTGLSTETLKKYRRNNLLVEDIHWIRLNCRTIRYNYALIKDWMQNRHDPAAHQQAIDVYLATLPSNVRRTKRTRRELS